jgi:hypothetical protein
LVRNSYQSFLVGGKKNPTNVFGLAPPLAVIRKRIYAQKIFELNFLGLINQRFFNVFFPGL